MIERIKPRRAPCNDIEIIGTKITQIREKLLAS